MSWKSGTPVMPSQREMPVPPLNTPAGSQGDTGSSMLTITVKSSGNKGVPETLPGDLTRTNETRSEAEPGPAPEPDLRPVAPTQVRDPHRYEIIAEHGRGGLGRVSRAHDRELGRDVAIKELLSRGHVSELRFMREALITARLEHPGIVPIHEAGRWPDGTPFYAMKLVSGRSLRELIVERTREWQIASHPSHGRPVLR